MRLSAPKMKLPLLRRRISRYCDETYDMEVSKNGNATAVYRFVMISNDVWKNLSLVIRIQGAQQRVANHEN